MSGIADIKIRNEKERKPELYKVICSPVREKDKMLSKEAQIEIMNRIKHGQCHW